MGDLDFEKAIEVFAQVVNAGKDGSDVILIETMSDTYEIKAAVLAAKENSICLMNGKHLFLIC